LHYITFYLISIICNNTVVLCFVQDGIRDGEFIKYSGSKI